MSSIVVKIDARLSPSEIAAFYNQLSRKMLGPVIPEIELHVLGAANREDPEGETS
jgi:uncharacterized protein (DUF433 family)